VVVPNRFCSARSIYIPRSIRIRLTQCPSSFTDIPSERSLHARFCANQALSFPSRRSFMRCVYSTILSSGLETKSVYDRQSTAVSFSSLPHWRGNLQSLFAFIESFSFLFWSLWQGYKKKGGGNVPTGSCLGFLLLTLGSREREHPLSFLVVGLDVVLSSLPSFNIYVGTIGFKTDVYLRLYLRVLVVSGIIM
jgi:hypothetical protein